MSAALIDEMELFTGLESNCFAGGNCDLGTSSWVSTDTGLPWFDGKYAESTKLDSIAGDQRLLHALEDSVYRSLCFRTWQACTLNNPLYEILLYHLWPPSLGCKFW